MIDLRAILLGGACLVLAGIIAVELQGDPAPDDTLIAAAPRVQPAREGAKPVPAHTDALVSTALARPLFSPSRRPADAAPASTQLDLNDKRLTGIVVNDNRRLAIFAVSGARSLTVGEGDEVNGWRVEAITPLEISLSGPGGTRTLQPKPDAKSRPEAPQVNNSRPPPPRSPPAAGAPASTNPASADVPVRRNRE